MRANMKHCMLSVLTTLLSVLATLTIAQEPLSALGCSRNNDGIQQEGCHDTKQRIPDDPSRLGCLSKKYGRPQEGCHDTKQRPPDDSSVLGCLWQKYGRPQAECYDDPSGPGCLWEKDDRPQEGCPDTTPIEPSALSCHWGSANEISPQPCTPDEPARSVTPVESKKPLRSLQGIVSRKLKKLAHDGPPIKSNRPQARPLPYDLDATSFSFSSPSFNSEYMIRVDDFTWKSIGDGEYFNEVEDSWVPEFLADFGDGCKSDEEMSNMVFTKSMDNAKDPFVYDMSAASPFSQVSIRIKVSAGTSRLALMELLRTLLRPKPGNAVREQLVRIPRRTLAWPESQDDGDSPAIMGGPWLGYRFYATDAEGKSPMPERFSGTMRILVQITASLRPGYHQTINQIAFRERQQERGKGPNSGERGMPAAPPGSSQDQARTFRHKPFMPRDGEKFNDGAGSSTQHRQPLRPQPGKEKNGRPPLPKLPTVHKYDEDSLDSVKGTFQGGSFVPRKGHIGGRQNPALKTCQKHEKSKMSWLDQNAIRGPRKRHS